MAEHLHHRRGLEEDVLDGVNRAVSARADFPDDAVLRPEEPSLLLMSSPTVISRLVWMPAGGSLGGTTSAVTVLRFTSFSVRSRLGEGGRRSFARWKTITGAAAPDCSMQVANMWPSISRVAIDHRVGSSPRSSRNRRPTPSSRKSSSNFSGGSEKPIPRALMYASKSRAVERADAAALGIFSAS